ncbi:VCBS repeat-containing protein, partial [Candidatus Poribacteria bacterium]|nr:VCBS repeat-containing protein [Candidatus Poribacteria bacterium]
MTDNGEVYFAKIRYAPDYDIFNCEKICLADIDNDGANEIVTVRWGTSGDKHTGEIAIYDMNLGLKASDRWDGLALDVAVSDINGDGKLEIIVAGSINIDKPVLKVFRYNKNYKGNLELSSQTSWGKSGEAFKFAKSIHIFEHDEPSIAVLTICQGQGEQKGYAQLRLYDKDMVLKGINKWNPMDASLVPWGHCMKPVDFDGNGNCHVITLVNFRHGNKQKADLRVFDHQLNLVQICDFLKDEALFATCMCVEDIDDDGETEIAIAGGTFSEVWKGATNSLMILNSQLSLKENTSWKTFRHSWVWDMQIMDLDRDGSKEIITYGGTAMNGKNQDDANIMGEICLWDSSGLATKDMFIWQSIPGEDTRPSRSLAFIDDDHAKILIATSRWSKNQQTRELEIGILNFEKVSGAIMEYSDLIKAYDEHDTDVLDRFIPQNKLIAPIALESLAFCDPGEAAYIAGKLLNTKDQNLFLRTVEILRKMGEYGIEELQRIGFSSPEKWAIISPFDNTKNN